MSATPTRPSLVRRNAGRVVNARLPRAGAAEGVRVGHVHITGAVDREAGRLKRTGAGAAGAAVPPRRKPATVDPPTPARGHTGRPAAAREAPHAPTAARVSGARPPQQRGVQAVKK